jgi:hypothetical protein
MKIFKAIVVFTIAMRVLRVDSYIVESLMPDLVGHDQKPSAFVVYLYLWSRVASTRSKQVQVSHQTIANDTGISKSAVQASIRHLVRRRLIRAQLSSKTAIPLYTLLRPWRRGGRTVAPLVSDAAGNRRTIAQ